MNTTRNIKATIERSIVVIDLPRTHPDDPPRAVAVDGVFRKHGDVIELDAGEAHLLIHSRRAREATPTEATSGDVIVARTRSAGVIVSNVFVDEDAI